MLGLAKLISSSLTGLSASGLGLYFIPKYFEDDSHPSQLIYKKGKSLAESEISTFEREEESVLSELEEFHSKLQKVDQALEGKKDEKYSLLQEAFTNIDRTEEELTRLYIANKSFFEELKKWGEKIFEKQKEKLEAEAELKELQYLNESMQKTSQVMKNWKDSINTIICAIDSKIADCSSTAGTATTQVSLGGGAEASPASKEAATQLEKSKEVFLFEKVSLIAKELKLTSALTISKRKADDISRKLQGFASGVKRYSLKSEAWNKKINEQLSKSQKTTEELNSFYKSLKDNYDKWEKLKRNKTNIGKYLGLFKSSICRNFTNYKN